MSVADVFNPYPEIQPRLYETWNGGFQVGLETTQGGVNDHMPEEHGSDALRYQAWRSGFREGREKQAS